LNVVFAKAQQPASVDSGDPGIHVSPREITSLGYAAAMNRLGDSLWGIFPVVEGRLVVRHDSIVTVMDSMVRRWSTALAQGGAPHRIELFSTAALYARTGQDAEAQQCIAQWLATPGLSDQDRAWILGKSIELFLGLLSPRYPKDPLPSQAHLAIAHQYLIQLEALPRTASAFSLFGIYRQTMELYLYFGLVDTTIAYGMRAFALPAQVTDYHQRFAMATEGGAVMTLALALSAYPERYHHTMDSVITLLRGYAMAPIPPAYGQYPWNVRYVTERRKQLEGTMTLVQTLGRPAPTLVATHWFNQAVPPTTSDATPGARIKPLNDGIVRLIGFGYFGCVGCQMVMKDWERFQHALPPGAAVLFYDRSEGFWGGDLIEPAEEAEHLRHFYVERKHYTFPIALWAGPKVANDEGGRVPLFSPTMGEYGFYGGPHFVIVDGNGILRYRGNSWSEPELLRVLIQLTREHRHGSAVSAASTAPSS